MPTVTVASVLSEMQKVYLNDPSAGTYTDAICLPFIKTAFEDLRDELAMNDVPTLEVRSAAQTIAALATSLTTVPTDFLIPQRMEERADGSSEQFAAMEERTWAPNTAQTERLRFWMWIGESIAFLGSTAAREVRLYYYSDLNPTGITAGSNLNAANARGFLAARASALVAFNIMQNTTLGQAFDMRAEKRLAKVIKIAVKNRQALPTRRRPFLGPRRRF